MAVWYLAHGDELLIDLDDATRPTRTGGAWLEIFFRRRLREADAAGLLPLRDVWITRSTSERHYHAIVRLARPLPLIERLIWQLHLGSDLYRGRADLMRAARDVAAPSLLILPAPIAGFWRDPDRRCACTAKHETAKLAQLGAAACDVWRELRGMSPWELFGRSALDAERAVRMPLGRVPLALIRERRVDPTMPPEDNAHGRKQNGRTESGRDTHAARA